jgi:hypothetical protein
MPDEITVLFFAASSSNAWFRAAGNEFAARMPTMQLDRPVHDVLATSMPPGRPSGDEPDAPESGHGSESEEEDEEEEANPS